MGGVVRKVTNVVEDVVEDAGDALGFGGGGGGSAAPQTTAKQDVARELEKVRSNPQIGNVLNKIRGRPERDGDYYRGQNQPISVTPQVVVYGPDGTAYSNPAAAEAAGVTNYTMTRPTFDQISPIRPFEPGEGGFFGGVGPIEAKTGVDPTQSFIGAPTTGFPVGGGSAAPSTPRSPYEAQTQFGLTQPAPRMPMGQTPFQRPDNMASQMARSGQAPLTPEQAMVFARQAGQRFAAGGAVQGGIGSLMGRMKRG